jgi:hypothetical protein
MATPAAALDQGTKVMSRYEEGYRLARMISGLSLIVKVVGVLAGIFVILFGTLGSATVMRPNAAMTGVVSLESQHYVYLLSVIFFGALVAMIGWLFGILLEAYGQHLKASLDAAVNGSPFLNNLDRTKIMRLD